MGDGFGVGVPDGGGIVLVTDDGSAGRHTGPVTDTAFGASGTNPS